CQMKAIMAQLRLSDLAKAEEELGNLLSGFAGNKELGPVVHEVVEEYRNTGAHEEGRELFAYLLENWDETPDTMLELQVGIALQSIKLREPNKVEAAVERLMADYNDHPKIAKGLFQIAEEHYYASEYFECANLLEFILASYPGRDFPAKKEVPYVLAACYEELKEYDEAIKYYKMAMEKYPQTNFAKGAAYRIGLIYMMRRYENQKAIEWFTKQAMLYQDTGQAQRALFKMGQIYVKRLHDWENGEQVLLQYVERYPQGRLLWGCLSMLATCQENLGKRTETCKTLQMLLDKARTKGLRKAALERIENFEKGGTQ
ncbi:MAG: tetratricopeptide repeat protein, partial [Planctomycetota bacterium]